MNYEKMYFYLFNKITDIENRLREMQSVCEEMYVNIGESESLVSQSAADTAGDDGGTHSYAAN